jgi:NADPH-dependent glutamate synthase beta subunit-like oxidoreductase
VAVVGGGPAGLTAAYYLALMGHRVTIYEKRKYLGGMLRYGIPSYRLPRERLQWDIDAVLSTGNITVKLETDIGDAAAIHALGAQYHSLFLTIGAHTEKRLGIEGESLRGVMSAVELLRAIGDNAFPDFTGKRVAVIGGGNVAMDAARSAIRLGAAKVSLVYRRRQEDMTALPEEVYGAAAEGCDLVTLQAPLKIEGNASDEAVALWTEPQMIGPMENGRPKPVCAGKAPVRLPCDILILAIGQDIDSKAFAEYGVKTRRGAIAAGPDGSIEGMSHDPGMAGVFAGGDCVTGPATVIRAIEAGKVAASNIDRALGFSHTITCDMEIPAPPLGDKKPWGRVNMEERESSARKRDFDPVEAPMSCPEATGEAGRCLRCDKFGLGAFRGGRIRQW